ncbi:MAG: thiamine pyrophosphate-binding protein [Holophagaceae bacterium]|nr:thiamine pyrophosphate-binding protein [Holophagaceae bacterium]
MIRVADYIAQTLAAHGVRHVFLVTGGGAMHLNDAFGRCKTMKYVACHHEQACAIAAESYFRLTGRLAAVNVTSGPGGLNTLTGIHGAWTDSIGMIVVSGQVRTETLVACAGPAGLRQLGDQEVDIVRIVSPLTKYAVLVTEPQSIRYHLERALHLAQSGRPGPVWIDVPMNVQGAYVDPESLAAYDPAEDAERVDQPRSDVRALARQALVRLMQSKRPVILPGTGVRISGAYGLFQQLVDRLGIPVATAFNAHDLLPEGHPCYVGRPGTIGNRSGNFAVQNADFVLVLGCRLNIRQISYNWSSFARAAYKVMVDVDALELDKSTLHLDLPIHADLQVFLEAMLDIAAQGPTESHRTYLAWCKSRQAKYPVVLDEYRANTASVNPYCFAEALFNQLPEGQIVVTGDGTACVTTFQAARIKKDQRLCTNSGCASMGYDLPAALGACVATEDETGQKRSVVCMAGDGSIQMNIQELQTLATHRLPIAIFLYNNQGYHSIRQTQRAFFPDNVVGCGTESGLGFPDFEKLCAAYGIPYFRVENHAGMEEGIANTLAAAQQGPVLCEVILDLEQSFAPKLTSRRLEDGRMVTSPLEDLAPFLPREEFKGNMLIPLDPSSLD